MSKSARWIGPVSAFMLFASACVIREGAPSTSSPSSPPPPPPPAAGPEPAPGPGPAPAPGPATPDPAPAPAPGPAPSPGKLPPALGEAPPPPDAKDPPPSTTPLPPQPPVTEPPEPKAPAEKLPAGIADGQPANMKGGAQGAFWIWRVSANVWRLRTTTRAHQHIFTGKLAGVTGPVTGVRPTRNELSDRIFLRADRVSFKFATKGDFDGFDFSTRKNTCVEFNLLLDDARPRRIFIGEKEVQPKTGHFIVCP
jgi:hypothetical protein